MQLLKPSSHTACHICLSQFSDQITCFWESIACVIFCLASGISGWQWLLQQLTTGLSVGLFVPTTTASDGEQEDDDEENADN